MKLKCMIVEDEPLAMDLLLRRINAIEGMVVVCTCTTANEALEILPKHEIDLIFLDVQMPGINGMEFAQRVEGKYMIIFTTAFDQYAVQGFNVSALDYILKPIDPNRLKIACDKAIKQFQLRVRGGEERSIVVSSQHKQIKIWIQEISYVEGLKDYVKIQVNSSERPILTRKNLTTIEKELNCMDFVRVHKSYLVNWKKVKQLNADSLVLDKFTIPIGPSYKKTLPVL